MEAVAWLLLGLVLVFALGPRPKRLILEPGLPQVDPTPAGVELALKAREAAQPVRPDNEARIVWAGQPGVQTPLCFVYLHGYSACWREGAPFAPDTARRYGANLLFTRLHEHGLIRDEPLMDLQATAMWADCKRALAEALVLGKEVVIIATSSGAPLADMLAAQNPDKVKALVLLSPNHRMREPGSWILDWPWGLHLARIVKKGKIHTWDAAPEVARYWYNRQRLEGAVQLQVLVRKTRDPKLLKGVTCPVYMAVYYENATHQDKTIHVEDARLAYDSFGTAPEKKRFQRVGGGAHVISCDLMNPRVGEVEEGAWGFLDEVVGLRAVGKQD